VHISRTKLTSYLLNIAHEQGSGKARFFIAQGFTRQRWRDLDAAIRQHPLDHPVHAVRRIQDPRTGFRTHYDIRCSLKTPNGADRCIKTVWAIFDGNPIPRLLTATPI